jgi:hypothetical protein
MYRHFCTFFDDQYLAKGLALYHSLERHCPHFQLWALCLNRPAYDILTELNLPHLRPIALEDFERGDSALLAAKANRSLIEYYFTCTPSLPLYILERNPEIELITYLDADLFFFAEPTSVFDEIGDSSIAIIEHRYSEANQYKRVFGIYNVGWVSFRRDEQGIECLRWWRERCIEWCGDKVKDGRYADQGYLDDWPERFSGVKVLQHKGANLAPWNLSNYKIHLDGECLLVDEHPLIFFHFHDCKQVYSWLYDSKLAPNNTALSWPVRRFIYKPYLQTLQQIDDQYLARFRSGQAPQRASIRYVENGKQGTVSIMTNVLKGLAKRQYILLIKGRAL